MACIFIDGSAGTTGLRIHERLSGRNDIELITLNDDKRKDPLARKEALNAADIVFLCLPDDAAKESVSLIENESTVVIDTSTAHRIADGWTYGFPELSGHREKIANSKRIANPGCHAGGFIALIEPLVKNGLLKKDAHLSCFSLTGYSGGGKKMIAQYEDVNNTMALQAPRMYGIAQSHKHLPEMTKISGLAVAPVFCPVVSSYYAGMEVTVPLFADDINGTVDDIKHLYVEYYTGNIVRYVSAMDDGGFISAGNLAGRDDMEITVSGNGDRILLISRFDNLGKGASGAAVQNMNIVLGIDETTGLNLEV